MPVCAALETGEIQVELWLETGSTDKAADHFLTDAIAV